MSIIILTLFYSLSIIPIFDYKIADLISLPLLLFFFCIQPNFFIRNKNYIFLGTLIVFYLIFLLFFSLITGGDKFFAIYNFSKSSIFIITFLITTFISKKFNLKIREFLISIISYFVFLISNSFYQLLSGNVFRIAFPFSESYTDPHLFGPTLAIFLIFLHFNSEKISFHLKSRLLTFLTDLIKVILLALIFLSGSRGALIIVFINILIYLIIKIIDFFKSLKINKKLLINIPFTLAFMSTLFIAFYERFSYSINRTFLFKYVFTTTDPRSSSIFYSLSKIKDYNYELFFGNFFQCPTFDFGLTYAVCTLGIFGFCLFIFFMISILNSLIKNNSLNNFYLVFFVLSIFLANIFGSESYTIARYSYPLAIMLFLQLEFFADNKIAFSSKNYRL